MSRRFSPPDGLRRYGRRAFLLLPLRSASQDHRDHGQQSLDLPAVGLVGQARPASFCGGDLGVFGLSRKPRRRHHAGALRHADDKPVGQKAVNEVKIATPATIIKALMMRPSFVTLFDHSQRGDGHQTPPQRASRWASRCCTGAPASTRRMGSRPNSKMSGMKTERIVARARRIMTMGVACPRCHPASAAAY